MAGFYRLTISVDHGLGSHEAFHLGGMVSEWSMEGDEVMARYYSTCLLVGDEVTY